MKSKKFVCIFVLFLFIIAVMPLVFAQSGERNLVRERQGGDVVDVQNQSRLEVQERNMNIKQNFVNVRDLIKNKKADVAKCLSEDGAEGCEGILAKDLDNRNQYLLHAVERIRNVLDDLKGGAQHITDSTEKDEFISEFEDEYGKLDDLVLQIEDVETREQFKEAKDAFKESYGDLKNTIAQFKVKAKLSRLHAVNQRLLRLNQRLQIMATKMEKAGVVLGEDYPKKAEELQNALDDAEIKLGTVRERYRHAKELRLGGADKKEVKTMVTEAEDYLKQARERIMDARDHIQDIIKLYRNRAGAEKLNEAISDTSEEISEE